MPERLAGAVPPLLVELLVGIVLAAAAVAARMPFVELAADRAPYAFNFAAVVLAAVLAGWRAGLVTLVAGQALTWVFLIMPQTASAMADTQRLTALMLATVSQILILFVIALYQREVAKGVEEREKRMDLLGEALEEIDHRTRNNYQTVLALVQLQAQRSTEGAVREALQQVADRIQAVTRATEHLAHRSEDLGTVRLRDHLCELCAQVERGLSRDGVKVECEVDDFAASTGKAIYLSIIVNELVTNALKHAFADTAEGTIRVASESQGEGVTIIVADDGRGMQSGQVKSRAGLGSRLVERFARELGCRHEVTSSPNGTTHRLLIPSLA